VSKKVLDVGQCDADHSRISAWLGENFSVEIDRAHSHDEAIKMVHEVEYDLVLLNRIMDADGTAGMDVLNGIKSDAATRETNVMVISNFEDAQKSAVSSGAVEGFGKAAMNENALEKLKPFLG